MTEQVIIKHLIVQKCEKMSYCTDIDRIMYKNLKIFGMQQTFFSKSVQRI